MSNPAFHKDLFEAKLREVGVDNVVSRWVLSRVSARFSTEELDVVCASLKTQSIPVVMLTGVGEKVGLRFSGEAMGEFYGVEPAAYLEKPIDPAALQQTVAEVLGA